MCLLAARDAERLRKRFERIDAENRALWNCSESSVSLEEQSSSPGINISVPFCSIAHNVAQLDAFIMRSTFVSA